MKNLIFGFIEEAKDLIEKIVGNCLQIENDPDNSEAIEELFRHLHTLKGSSAIFEIKEFTNLSHIVENILDDIRSGKISIDEKIIEFILKSSDILSEWIDYLSDNETLPDNAREVLDQISLEATQDDIDDRPEVACLEENSLTNGRIDGKDRFIEDSKVIKIKEKEAKSAGCNLRVDYLPNKNSYLSGQDPVNFFRKAFGIYQWSVKATGDGDEFDCTLNIVGWFKCRREDILSYFSFNIDEIKIQDVDSTIEKSREDSPGQNIDELNAAVGRLTVEQRSLYSSILKFQNKIINENKSKKTISILSAAEKVCESIFSLIGFRQSVGTEDYSESSDVEFAYKADAISQKIHNVTALLDKQQKNESDSQEGHKCTE